MSKVPINIKCAHLTPHNPEYSNLTVKQKFKARMFLLKQGANLEGHVQHRISLEGNILNILNKKTLDMLKTKSINTL